MFWYVYIARAKTGLYYTGIAIDPQKRIIEHNSGIGAKFAHDQGQLTLLYVSPPFPKQSLARLRELQIKGWSRWKKEKLINGEWK